MDNYTDRPDDHAARNDFLVDTALRRHRRSEKRKITPRVNAHRWHPFGDDAMIWDGKLDFGAAFVGPFRGAETAASDIAE
jgi:hypothetical protein